jgi:hypothetical protein
MTEHSEGIDARSVEKPGGSTGQAGVDAALGALSEAADLTPGEQVGAYEEAHRALSQTLAGIDEG